jgi:hypothetical protein
MTSTSIILYAVGVEEIVTGYRGSVEHVSCKNPDGSRQTVVGKTYADEVRQDRNEAVRDAQALQKKLQEQHDMMTLDSFWDFAKPPSKPPIYRDCTCEDIFNYKSTFDVCTIHDLLTCLPEMLEEDVDLHTPFVESLCEVLSDSAQYNLRDWGYQGVNGSHFVHVRYDGDEPQEVVFHGENINHSLVEADHKRYNCSPKPESPSFVRRVGRGLRTIAEALQKKEIPSVRP